ncbi:HdeD family acid-resistance protein [Cognatishimia activa]|uniref:HdeD family acid-resistance protein n=1 Tax=Cognatishimia activa TaxID=1715691 RepID=UPI002231D84D|nr:DUF308 domain-containing protein [Cognatishimia activa]UZD90316.1 DUF308 domain-containing protein [Cognatishimia activa]
MKEANSDPTVGGIVYGVGVGAVILGIIAIAAPIFTTIALKVMLGWMLLLFGALVVYAALRQGGPSPLFSFLIGAICLFVGGWLAFFPLTGLLTLTIILAIQLVGQGILELIVGVTSASKPGRGVMILSGIVGVVAGIFVFAGLPSTASWALGLMFGLSLLTSGWAYMAMGAGLKKMESTVG